FLPFTSVCNADSSGISAIQGAHHVAQKLTSRFFPFHCDKGWDLPCASGMDWANSLSTAGASGFAVSKRLAPKYAPDPANRMAMAKYKGMFFFISCHFRQSMLLHHQ